MEKAKRATIQLGDRELDVFQLPDGSYRLSQSQVAQAAEKPEANFRNFLGTKWLKALPGIDSSTETFSKVEYEGRGRPINAVPLAIAYAFWVFQVWQRNKAALPLVIALGTETLARRADAAFGVQRSEAEYAAAANELMAVVGNQNQVLKALEENYAIDDEARETAAIAWAENQRLRELLEANGIDYSSGGENHDNG